jgi:hypothetical protein
MTMNKHLLTACLLMAFGSLSHGQITTNLKIDGSALGLTAPSVTLGKFSILDYVIDDNGLLSLNHAFANSGGANVAAWGDALDYSGASGLSVGSGFASTFGIRIYGVSLTGADGEVKSGDDTTLTGYGLGVGGGNQWRLDWNAVSDLSEGLRFQITTTGLASTHKIVITGLQFGYANASGGAQPAGKIDTLVNMTGFSGGELGSIPTSSGPHSFTIPDGGLSVVGGGGSETVGSFVLYQANKPTGTGSGVNAGFTLQGITFDVVPVAVPEPATVAIYAGLAVMGLAVWRRRRRA